MVAVLWFVIVATLTFIPALPQAQDPCQTNVILGGDVKRSFDNVKSFNDIENGYCDISLRDGWYRLKVGNKDVGLAPSAPPPGACNAFYPIWMNGSVPTVLNQEKSATACMVTSQDTDCGVSLDIKVMNCGEYNVYYLRQIDVCPAAYCFDVRGPCPEGTSSETGTFPDCSVDFPRVNVTPAVEPLLGRNAKFEDLRFRCNFTSPDTSYFYDVVWRINGDEVTRIIQKSADDQPVATQLLETEWKTRYRLGIYVQCSVRVRASEGGIPSPEHHSEEFFAGLKTLNSTVEVTEGESVMILYQATVPVPCTTNAPCRVFFTDYTYENIDGRCKRTLPGHCGVVVDSENWNAVVKLRVTGDYDNMYGDRLAEIFLKSAKPIPDGPLNVWTDVSPQVARVNIHDMDAQIANTVCYVRDDPHFTSFDKRDFDVHLAGEFVLYRHKTLPQEVRGFFQPCGDGEKGIPHCVCGVAVRSGQQIFMWSKCKDNRAYQTALARNYGCNQRQMRITNNQEDSSYQVHLPNGLKVDIGSTFIMITPSAADFNQVTGLCGNFNGNKDDEFVGPDGTQHSDTCDFLLYEMYCVVNKYGLTWKVTNISESYYGYPDYELQPAPIGKCFCNSTTTNLINRKNVTCTNAPPRRCDSVNRDVTEEYCTQISGPAARRKKREAQDPEGINDEDVRPVFPTYNVTDFKPPEWTNGWNEEKARDHCLNFYKKSPAFDPCSKVSNIDVDPQIDFCVLDILLSGTTNWTLASLESFKHSCISEVRRNTTLWVEENNEPSVLNLVMEASCPEECSFHGSCIQGECECEAGWIGDDCSIDMNQPPEVFGLPKSGLCDIRNRECDRILVYGKRFARSSSLLCKFEPVNVNNGTIVRDTRATSFIVAPYYRHSEEIVCPLPSNATLGTNEEGFPVGYYLSVSNYNDVFSHELFFLPYDSADYVCSIMGMEANCEKIKVTTVRYSTTDVMHTIVDDKEDGKDPKSGSPIDRTTPCFMIMMVCWMKWMLI